MNENRVLDISWGTILKIALIVVSFYVLYQIKHILIWFLFALIISLLFNPAINFFQKLKIPRVLATLSTYSFFFGILILLIYSTIPLFASEIRQLSHALPQYFEKIAPPLEGLGIKAFEDIDTLVEALGGTLEKMAVNIFNIFFVIFGGIFATFFTLAIAIFLSLEEKGVEKSLTLFFPKKYENYLFELWEKCQRKVSGWFMGRVVACLFVGIASLVTFLLFDIPHPFTLGLLAGALNFIPFIGPMITGVLLFIIIALENISKAIFVLIAFILIQQIENNILTPFLLKKFVDLSPALVLISLATGGALFGFLGAILAVPLAGILVEFFREFLEKRRDEKTATL